MYTVLYGLALIFGSIIFAGYLSYLFIRHFEKH